MIDKNKKDKYGEPLVTAKVRATMTLGSINERAFNNADNHEFVNHITKLLNWCNNGNVAKIEIDLTYTGNEY